MTGFYPYNELAEVIDVTIENPTGCLYVYGESGLLNSVKFCVDEDYVVEVLKFTGEIWELGEFRAALETFFAGHNLAISAAGDQLLTSNSDGTNKHLYVRSTFTDDEGTNYARRLHLTDKVSHFISQSDDSGEFNGPFLTYVESGFIGNLLSVELYLKVGSTDATQGINLSIYNGPDNTYTKKFAKNYPPSTFSARSGTVIVTDDGGIAKFTLGAATDLWEGMEVVLIGLTNYTNGTYQITSTDESTYFKISTISYTSDDSGNYATSEIHISLSDHVDIEQATSNTFEFSSSSTFSLKTNAAKTKPWLAGNFYPAYYYVFLDSKQWTENDATTQGDWQILPDERKIAVANQNSTAKLSTFVAESRKWNEISPFIFSWETLPSDQDLLIPENHQMAVHGTFTLQGDLNLQGTLVIRD